MSKLGRFFKGGGSSKGRGAPSPQEALSRLRETEEMLGKKQDYLENRIQRELALARMHGKQNKRGRLPAPSPSRSPGRPRGPCTCPRAGQVWFQEQAWAPQGWGGSEQSLPGSWRAECQGVSPNLSGRDEQCLCAILKKPSKLMQKNPQWKNIKP